MLKNLSIRTKLLLGFLVIILSIIIMGIFFILQSQKVLEKKIGENSVLLAQETIDKIDRNIQQRVERWQSFNDINTLLKETITKSNQEFDVMENPQEYIQEKNIAWTSAKEEEITPFMQELIDEKLSEGLRKRADFYKKEYEIFPEIFVTNKYGVNVTQTVKTIDYYQADEEWWQKAKEDGLYVEDVTYDEFVKAYSINLCMRIEDEFGNFSGVMKIVYNIEDVIDIINEFKTETPEEHTAHGHEEHKTMDFKLLTHSGKIIYATEEFEMFEDIYEQTIAKFGKLEDSEHKAYFIGTGDKSEEGEELFAHFHSQGYKNYKGLGWYLIIESETDDIFAPIYQLRNILIYICLFIIIFASLTAFYISRSIPKMALEAERLATITQKNLSVSVPILQKISKGDLSMNLEIPKKKDEFTELLVALNLMIDDLRKADKIQKKYAVELEQKISERTESLADKVKDLKQAQEAMLNVLEDVERKNNELAADKAKDDAILASIGDAVMACDKNGRIILFNSIAEKLSGFSEKEVIGGHYSKYLKFINEETKKPSKDFIAQTINTGNGSKMANHTIIVRKDGQKIPVADSAAPVKDIHGNIAGCVVVFRDVAREREIDKMKTEFVSVASHQLRTPLTAIKLFIEMLGNEEVGKLNPEQKDYIENVQQSTKRMINLVNDLLNVSRIEMGRLKIEPKPTQLKEFIQSIINESKLIFKEHKCKVIFKKLTTEIPKIPLDQTLIRQVIHNLITNAIKYSNSDRCGILVKLDQKGDSYIISVQDNGIGIPKEAQSRIFQKFFRADNAQKEEVDGSGLGLYVAKMILEKSGGKIWFKSEEDKGTTFFVSLPKKGMQVKKGEMGLIDNQ